MITTLRVGLVGLGAIGLYHLAAIEELERQGRVRLVGVADPAASRFPELRERLQARGVRWHADYRDLLQNEPELDAVTIAAPISLHYEMTRACLERDLFVHLEKPPVPAIQQLDELIRLDVGNRVVVGFQMILSDCVQRMKELITEGDLGEISEIRICGSWPRLDRYYARAGWAGKMTIGGKPVFDGPATNALAHLIHNMMFLATPEPGGFDAPVEVRGEFYRARPIESYDVACARGRFGSGVRFTAAVAHAAETTIPFRLEVRGSKGSALLSEDGNRLESNRTGCLERQESTQELLLKSHREFEEFARGERPRASTSLRDCRGYVLATNGMLASSGGIHDIPDSCIRTYQRDGDNGYDVAGLHDAIEDSFRTGRSFSEQGIPWAKPGAVMGLEDFHTIDFAEYIPDATPLPEFSPV